MVDLEDVRKDYLVFIAIHIAASLILTFLTQLISVRSLIGAGYTTSKLVTFLLTFAVYYLFTGIFFGTALIIYGLYQRFSNERTFNPKQFAAIFLIGAFIFVSSLAISYALEEQEIEDYQDRREAQRCTNILKSQTSVTDEAIKIPANCLEGLREIEGLEDLEENDKIKKTQSGFVVAE
jgi:hypothetical protein